MILCFPSAGRAPRRLAALGVTAFVLFLLRSVVAPAASQALDLDPFPPSAAAATDEAVSFPSRSPFALADAADAPATTARGDLYRPAPDGTGRPVPAVVLLHGSGGPPGARESLYARRLAAAGVAALVVDVFGARRDLGTGYVARVLNITEAMFVADAYAALDFLASRPGIDARRTALVGFSYGGLASVLAAYDQVARAFAPGGRRFAGHVAYYAPCVARFVDPTTTGAPVLMLYGDRDATVSPAACARTADELGAGGSSVETVVFPGARHGWDGPARTPRRLPRHIAGCAFEVGRDGATRDASTGVAMTGPLTRRLILAACSDADGYVIARDDRVAERSDAVLGRFLSRVFGGRDTAESAASPPAR